MENPNVSQMLSGSLETLNATLRNSTDSTERIPKWSRETERLVTILFHRIASLYRAKAGDYQIDSREFKTWCWKLNHLTPAQFAQGARIMERQEADARRTGDDSWPPSYAGFIGIATMQLKSRSTVEALPASIMSRNEAREKLAALRTMLGGPTGTIGEMLDRRAVPASIPRETAEQELAP